MEYVNNTDIKIELYSPDRKRVMTLFISNNVYNKLEVKAFKKELTAEELILEMLSESNSLVKFLDEL